ncbi:elongation factor Ts, mitochondrial-like isoform X1, partial [Argonauta hians]
HPDSKFTGKSPVTCVVSYWFSLCHTNDCRHTMLISSKSSVMARAMQVALQGHMFHSSACTGAAGVDKKLLSALRKKTGFTFVNCKKALEKFSGDLHQAESWLREQAQKEGWQKALKLQGRPMSQGLVAVRKQKNFASIIELNCETDFVARNVKFQELVQSLSTQCQTYFNSSTPNSKVLLSKEEVNQIVEVGGKGSTLGDLVAKEVGNIGENMALRRAAYLASSASAWIGSYVHSTLGVPKTADFAFGKFGAIVSIKSNGSDGGEVSEEELAEVGQRLSQHIVGMNPDRVGDLEQDKPHEDKDQEKALIFQEFLLDNSKTVGEYLTEKSVAVLDFVRFECGEVLSEDETNKEGSPEASSTTTTNTTTTTDATTAAVAGSG